MSEVPSLRVKRGVPPAARMARRNGGTSGVCFGERKPSCTPSTSMSAGPASSRMRRLQTIGIDPRRQAQADRDDRFVLHAVVPPVRISRSAGAMVVKPGRRPLAAFMASSSATRAFQKAIACSPADSPGPAVCRDGWRSR